MQRLYDNLLISHLDSLDEMVFISGPRQVGKTTTSRVAEGLTDRFVYLNCDIPEHRQIILQGNQKIIDQAGINRLSNTKPIIVFDEIHKIHEWKNLLKGFYDQFGKTVRMIVTGSARLEIYRKGGDSLMGRYFPYHMHPLSVGECLRTNLLDQEIAAPIKMEDEQFNTLYQYGGFPKPFLTATPSFSNRWQSLRKQQLFREDIRDINLIHDINKLEDLAELLQLQAASSLNYSSIAKHLRITVETVSRWIEILESFYFCFRLRPWTKNIARSLLKEPKIFLIDWASLADPGAKAENFVASHLLKAVQYWTDRGFGQYELFYLRTLEKKEVDFLVCKNERPWFLVEVKNANNQSLSPHLHYFQTKLQAPHAFQVVLDSPYVDKDCFEFNTPMIVPARTFLSQLP